MKKNNIKISIFMNILIFILVLASVIMMFTGFKFMPGYDIVLTASRIEMFKFFTVDSNVLIGIVSLIFAIKEIQLIKGKINDIPTKYYILKLMAVSAVWLTCFVVFTYLGSIAKHGLSSLLMNSNLFFHLIIPVLSILIFIMFEKTDKIKFKHTLYGIVPTVVYGVYYLINVLLHVENGMVSPAYDWYWFVQSGIWTALVVIPLIFGITYIISLIIWRLNRKKELKMDIQEKACGCIIIKDNKVLLIQQNAGHWGFPKGHVEENESEQETAIREVKEETNIDVKITDTTRYTVEYMHKGNLKQVVLFIAEPISNDLKPQAEEISVIEWLSFEDALNRFTYDNVRDLFVKILKEKHLI